MGKINWKNHKWKGKPLEESREQLIEKRNQLTFKLGQAKLNEEIAKAEGLQIAQQVLDTQNKIAKMPDEAPKPVEAEVVPESEVIPAPMPIIEEKIMTEGQF